MHTLRNALDPTWKECVLHHLHLMRPILNYLRNLELIVLHELCLGIKFNFSCGHLFTCLSHFRNHPHGNIINALLMITNFQSLTSSWSVKNLTLMIFHGSLFFGFSQLKAPQTHNNKKSIVQRKYFCCPCAPCLIVASVRSLLLVQLCDSRAWLDSSWTFKKKQGGLEKEVFGQAILFFVIPFLKFCFLQRHQWHFTSHKMCQWHFASCKTLIAFGEHE